jgi:glutamyl-tRNA synthetase
MSPTLINQTIPLVKDRLNKLSDYPDLVDFLTKEPKIDKKLLIQKGKTKKETEEILSVISRQLSAVSKKKWKAKNLEKLIRQFSNSLTNWSTSQLFMSIRIALTGKTATPPLFESMEVLGKKKTLKRLKKASA